MINLEELSGIFITSDKETIDVTNLVYKIDFYQNIYDPFVTGAIVLKDGPSSRLAKLFKESIVGKGEELGFEMRTATKPASRNSDLLIEKYYIYKSTILPMESAGEGLSTHTIILNFSSRYMFINEFNTVNQFHYDTISNIVSSIVKNYFGVDIAEIEDTEEKQFIILPGMNPLQTILWLSNRAYASPKKNKSSKLNAMMDVAKSSFTGTSANPTNNNFVFYEDIEHNYHFVSLGKLFLNDPVIGSLEETGIVLKSRAGNSLSTYEASYSAIQHISKSVCPISNAKNGMYASTCLTFDLTRKKYAKLTMSYDELFKKQNHFYDKQLVDPELDSSSNILNSVYDHPETCVKYFAKSSYMFTPNENLLKGNTPSNCVQKWALQRIASMEAMDQQGIDVEIRGNVGIQLGDVVLFSKQEINTTVETEFMKNLDPLFFGKYLITKIKHSLENSGSFSGFNLRTSLSLRRDCDYPTENGGAI